MLGNQKIEQKVVAAVLKILDGVKPLQVFRLKGRACFQGPRSPSVSRRVESWVCIGGKEVTKNAEKLIHENYFQKRKHLNPAPRGKTLKIVLFNLVGIYNKW